ncbi:MAG: aldo/keto reductase [Candidatus Korobacteraceae bacterium]|jgi:aryl-alcohol dehydrogenase-like predicted oxidoreductase
MPIPHIKLKHTDLEVSRLCFGTMTLGKPLDQAGSTQIVNRCIEAGINFFDTANMYQYGVAETMLGNAIKGKRDKLVVASKVFFKMGDGPDQQGLSRKAILRAIDESLGRLGTDYLDLYYFHAPDHKVPVEESMEAMESLVKQGKVRSPASSNYAGWEVVQMLCLAKERGWHAPYISQPMYNLLARGIEQEYLPMCKQFGVSTVVYNPLAGGLLTGKHRQSQVIPGTRFDNNKLYRDRYWHEQYFRAVERLKEIAKSAGRSMVSLSLNWLLHHTTADCVILGASSMEQLNQNLAAGEDGPLPEDVVKACDQVWQELRGPLPVYNR